MRTTFKLLLVLLVLTIGTYTLAAQITPTPAPAQLDKAFQGTLIKVDSDAKTLTAKDADNKEMMFHYTDKTEVVGSEKSVQGLAGKSGAKLTVIYKVEKGINNAMRIELMP